MSEILFSGAFIDRHSAIRQDETALSLALNEPTTRFILIWQGLCLVRRDGIALLARDQVEEHLHNTEHRSFLGRLDDRLIFALEIKAQEAPAFAATTGEVEPEFTSIRELSSTVPEQQAGLAALARALVLWQNLHRHCGVCGASNRVTDGGFVMACSDAGCAHRSFPRLDPAIIVLVHRGECALLGRQVRWPEPRFSTIAGFVEPGESLEDTLRREVAEETNIKVGASTYIASQPWPFPSALMIGFHAEALSEEIVLNDGELAEARWVSRRNITAGDVILPPQMSVAYHLIETWFDQYDGPPLASYALPDSPLQLRRT